MSSVGWVLGLSVGTVGLCPLVRSVMGRGPFLVAEH